MSELPKGWTESNLGSFCEIYQPATLAKSELSSDGPYPVYGANGIIGWHHEFNHAEPQLLITCRGATCGTVNVSQPNSWINGNAMVVRPDPECVEMRFAELFFRGPADYSQIITGSAQPQITRQNLAPVSFPIPPINEQRRIVAKLDSLRARSSRAREELDHIPKLIERYKQAILAKAFSGELTAAIGPVDKDVASERLTLAPNPPDFARHLPTLPDLPTGWIWTSLGSIARIIDPNPSHRYPSYVNGTIPLLSTREFSGADDWMIDSAPFVSEEVYASQNDRCEFSADDIIFARKGRLGLARRPPPLKKFTFSHTIFVIKPSKLVKQDYLLWYLRRAETETWLLREMNSNTGVPTLGKGTLELLPIAIPGLALQEHITNQIVIAMTWLDKVATEHTRAEHLLPKLDQAILAKAFRGELVSQDPSDEPASALLERIKAERKTETGARRRGRHPQN